MKKIVHIVGARPNFMKLAPVYNALSKFSNIEQVIIHTGQHYSENMSDIFFKQLELPKPHYNLEINKGSVLNQIGNGILKLESIFSEIEIDLLCVYGDVNSTAYASLTASKLGIKIAHIEAGLRSNDLSMPEEINRIITDSLSTYFFTPSIDANENLIKEGKSEKKIHFVGNVMIDTLVKFLPKIKNITPNFELPNEYILVTLHRPSNVDNIENLMKIMIELIELSNTIKIIFPIHPRTNNILNKLNLDLGNFILLEPLDYFNFIKIQMNAKCIITDSGGVQEESTFLKVPCFTLRENTERPITIKEGTNILAGSDITILVSKLLSLKLDEIKNKAKIPNLWDGNTGVRIAEILYKIIYTKIEK
ncbi:MAG: UDP-N-acetylglucosamine 2-epimerase (non-hydrolyzing) [Flavobacteriia bacterium]|nr:UDP-N-acetylglucosamine 2-epimerase (non-hydrolyzing) [Flavobacteriia bacterium]